MKEFLLKCILLKSLRTWTFIKSVCLSNVSQTESYSLTYFWSMSGIGIFTGQYGVQKCTLKCIKSSLSPFKFLMALQLFPSTIDMMGICVNLRLYPWKSISRIVHNWVKIIIFSERVHFICCQLIEIVLLTNHNIFSNDYNMVIPIRSCMFMPKTNSMAQFMNNDSKFVTILSNTDGLFNHFGI